MLTNTRLAFGHVYGTRKEANIQYDKLAWDALGIVSSDGTTDYNKSLNFSKLRAGETYPHTHLFPFRPPFLLMLRFDLHYYLEDVTAAGALSFKLLTFLALVPVRGQM